MEDSPSFARLGDYGCDTVQGFHVSQPLESADLLAWVRRQSPCALVTPPVGPQARGGVHVLLPRTTAL